MDNVMWLYYFYMNNFEFKKKNYISYPLKKFIAWRFLLTVSKYPPPMKKQRV